MALRSPLEVVPLRRGFGDVRNTVFDSGKSEHIPSKTREADVVGIDEGGHRQKGPLIGLVGGQLTEQLAYLIGEERVAHKSGICRVDAVWLTADPSREAESVESVCPAVEVGHLPRHGAVPVIGHQPGMAPDRNEVGVGDRSEERRVGKECRSTWSPYH